MMGIRVLGRGPDPKPTKGLEECQEMHPSRYVWDTFVLDDSYDSEDCEFMGASI